MIDVAQKKIGIIACSGEELSEGTISRLASLRVLEQKRPSDTVTICLPLFLAGGEGDRAFAKFYPTIAIDGCEKRCAFRATEKYSNRPAAGIVITDLIKQHGLDQPKGINTLNEVGSQIVEIVADEITMNVDELLGRNVNDQPEVMDDNSTIEQTQEEVNATCSCGSGIPIQSVVINGQKMDIVALPLIFQNFWQRGIKPDNGFGNEMLEMVKIYNQINSELEPIIKNVIAEEYAAYWNEQEKKS